MKKTIALLLSCLMLFALLAGCAGSKIVYVKKYTFHFILVSLF